MRLIVTPQVRERLYWTLWFLIGTGAGYWTAVTGLSIGGAALVIAILAGAFALAFGHQETFELVEAPDPPALPGSIKLDLDPAGDRRRLRSDERFPPVYEGPTRPLGRLD